MQKTWTDLAWEGCPIQRLYKLCVHLIGTDNDGGHGLLVLQRGGGQKRERCQGDVVLDTGQAALVVAVWTQAAQKHRAKVTGGNWTLSKCKTFNPVSRSTLLEACGRACCLTWTPERRPRCRWQGRVPGGWLCVPTRRGSGRAWPFQKLC